MTVNCSYRVCPHCSRLCLVLNQPCELLLDPAGYKLVSGLSEPDCRLELTIVRDWEAPTVNNKADMSYEGYCAVKPRHVEVPRAVVIELPLLYRCKI